MKASGAVLTLVLIAAAFWCGDQATVGSNPPVICCFTFTSKKIPPKLVVGYEATTSTCVSDGVILSTRRGLKICANPEEKWVQNIMKLLDDKKTTTESGMTTATAASF
ncbi:C-C motif chemokine 4 homolog [Gracilinanus agilis]|uniref:C-C motif chemokine 4 homolog n=1 Tax=Gracilinanus agilis TaxID=191870 RepID=UPI001CFEFE55|nr:C-C motif chemokine 4 homolog [Gracilinanus agilis]